MRSRLLIVSHEAPGALMSGPAIRYWQLAQTLADEFEVSLAVPGAVDLPPGRVNLVRYGPDSVQALRNCAAGSHVTLVAGFVLRHYPFLLKLSRPMVVDLYDPFVLENLAIHSQAPLPEQAAINRVNQAVLAEQLSRGDFFLCASQPQRDFWLGMLTAAGRVNPYTFQADPTLRQLIDVVPFGLPDAPPDPAPRALKGVVPGITAGDQVIYWGGGRWDWFDPLTAIRAVAGLIPRWPRLRLFFAGVAHPNPAVPPMRQAAQAERLSAELGLTDRHVFFNSWVPYADRAAYLLDADVGLSLHFDQVETRFAYRTRLLDYVWTGLPMVITRGDTLGEQAAERGLAMAVAPGDVGGVVEALSAYLSEPEEHRAARQARARVMADELRWSQVVWPLRNYCRAPVLAADRSAAPAVPTWRPSLVGKAWQSLRQRGLVGLWRDIRVYLDV